MLRITLPPITSDKISEDMLHSGTGFGTFWIGDLLLLAQGAIAIRPLIDVRL